MQRAHKASPNRFLITLLLSSLTLYGCDDDSPNTSPADSSDDASDTSPPLDSDGSDSDTTIESWNDHTVPSILSPSDFTALAANTIGIDVVKFIITSYNRPALRSMRYYDSKFFTLHDEWYWFRLLNGQPVAGDEDIEPVPNLSFDSIDAIYTWAKQQTALPLDLTFVANDDRLYSPRFYSLALAQRPRHFGVGSLLRLPPYDNGTLQRDEIWAFELEFSDSVDHPDIVIFFTFLEATLPPEIGPKVKWVVRSPVQETLARQMEAQQLPYHDRILRYEELSIPGEVQVYSEGLTAGRLLEIPASGEGLDKSRVSDMLLLASVPDWLPPAAGLITAVPQTPLAHINVLARNRGIPNAYRGGLLDDPAIDQLARVRAPVVVEAKLPDQLRIVQMTEDDYLKWRELGVKPPASVPQVDIASLPYTMDLTALSVSESDALRSSLGGKSVGMLALLAQPELEVPDRPVGVTIRPYAEHLAQLQPLLTTMLNDVDFKAGARARFLMLEGLGGFSTRYTSPDDIAWRDTFLQEHPSGDPLGDMVLAGGFKKVLRDTPIPPATLAPVEDALRAHYAPLSPRQGLRFRSSSTVEDIEGFNGAGLYDSNTGFLDPAAQPASSDRKKTIEWALKATWASYWGFEAFEERRLEGIDHVSGNMGVMVHPRFDDGLEITNGVFLFTVFPPGSEFAGMLELNVQQGDLSVTNPDSPELPEVDFVWLPASGDPVIERRQASTLSAAPLLDDAALIDLAHKAQTITGAWLALSNLTLVPEKRGRTQTLDFEFREMPPEWPMYADGTLWGERVVLKQARSLEPGLRSVPDTLKNLPFPRDILARASRGERLLCTADVFTLTTSEVYTNPLSTPDMGFTYSPFTAFISLQITTALPDLALTTSSRLVAHHLQADFSHPGMTLPASEWSLSVVPSPALVTSSGVQSLTLNADQTYTLTSANAATRSGSYSCASDILMATPDDFLRNLLDQAE